MSMESRHTDPRYWRRLGLAVGHERGTLDRHAGSGGDPEQLWIPEDTPDAYVAALKEGYAEGFKGAPLPEELA